MDFSATTGLIGGAAVFGALGVALSLLRYATYLRAIYKGTTKPHAFTWINAALMSGIAAVIQYIDNAGPTLWVTAVVAASCAFISILALYRGERHITRSDWAAFLAGLAIIPVWLVTKEPLTALLLVLMIEIFGYFPTVRKSWSKPQEEDLVSWALSGARWLCATLAVTSLSPLSLAYPLFLTVTETAFVLFLFIRQRQLRARLA